MRFLELKIPPLAVLVLFALAVYAAGRWLPSGNLPFVASPASALAAVVAGVGMALAGVVQFRRTGTTVDPLAPGKASALVDAGVYRWTRNPMYLGMALVLGSIPGVALVGGFCAYLTRFQIVPEERALQAIFGDAYIGYMSRVRRWI
jgi:protein-S-isoprenylcysteine O-methyltransferase Ste14